MTNPDNKETPGYRETFNKQTLTSEDMRIRAAEGKRLFDEETKRKEDAGYGWFEVKYVPGERDTEIKQITVNETGVLIHAVVINTRAMSGDISTSLWRSKNAGITWERLLNAAPPRPR